MKDLICIKRLRYSTATHTSILSSTQSDRARLIYSAPFRRLQQKAQVFSLETNSAVRSRLTHSIEVSHIGRYIVASIVEKLNSDTSGMYSFKNYWLVNSLAISNVVETACLMHDIGNPPFGHFGEAAISKWFTSESCENVVRKSFSEEAGKDTNNFIKTLREKLNLLDFELFDGNPQGLRIISKLQGDDAENGYNLTCTQIASFLKYVYSPKSVHDFNTLEAASGGLNVRPAFSKKIGFFSTEEKMIFEVWSTHKMNSNTRHPLGYLMEAADDISYCISDIEDGIEKGVISIDEFVSFMKEHLSPAGNANVLAQTLLKKIESNKSGPISPFLLFKTELSNQLVDYVATSFLANFEKIMSAELDSEILHRETEGYKVLNILRNFTADNIFSAREVESVELAGYSAIIGLLDIFSKLLALNYPMFEVLVLKDNKKIKHCKLQIESRLYNLLPVRYLNLYKKCSLGLPRDECFMYKEWNLRAHLIVDYISGMTDNFAIETFQMLKGIKIV